MPVGVVFGGAASYALVQASRDGRLASWLDAPQWVPWLWVAGVGVLAVLLALAWLDVGRGFCLAASVGCVIAAVAVHDAGHARFAPPLLSLAGSCVLAYAAGTFRRDRIRRPTT